MPSRQERVFKETLYSITRTENKNNTLPCAHELVAQIDSSLRHLQGQKKILENMKGHRKRTEKCFSNHTSLKHPTTYDAKCFSGNKANCQHVCDVFQKFAEKGFVKVADSSTQMGSSFYNPNIGNDPGHSCKDVVTYTNSPPKTIEFGQNVHLGSDGSSVHTDSKTYKNKLITKRVNSSTHVDGSRRTLRTTPRGFDIPKPSLDPRQQSQRFEMKGFEKSHFRKRSKERKQRQEVHTFHTNCNASEEAETYLIQQSKNLPGFLFDDESPRDDLRTNRNTLNSLRSHKTPCPTPSSIKRNHAKLSRDILDYASRIKDLEAMKISSKQRTCNIKRKSYEISLETPEKPLPSGKEPRRKTNEISEDYKNLRTTYRFSEKRTEVKHNIYKHGALINAKPDKIKTTFNKKEGTKLSLKRHNFEKSNEEHQLDDNEICRSKTNDLSEASSMSKTNSVNVKRPNVIDDSTYICPDNSEDNEYLILPYKSKVSEDSVHLNLSPKPTIENYRNQNSFPNEITSKSVVLLEDLSSQESQIIQSSNLPQLEKYEAYTRAENSHHEHHINPKNCFSQNKELTEKNNRDDTSFKSFDKSDNMSHNLERTWESHIHRHGPYSSKFETSHDPRILTSSEYRSRYQNLKNQLLESNPKGPSKKHSSINPSAQKVELKSKVSMSQGKSTPLSSPRSTLYEPEEQVIDPEPSCLEIKMETGKQSEKTDQFLEHNPNRLPNPHPGSERPKEDFSKETLSENNLKDTFLLSDLNTASRTKARNSVSSQSQQTYMEEKSSNTQSPKLNNSINELPTTSSVLKQEEEFKQQLEKDMSTETSKQLKSSRKESALGAISGIINVSPRVSSNNDQLPTKYSVLKQEEEFKQYLEEDMSTETSKQLKSSRKESASGAISGIINVSPRVSSYNDQNHMTQNKTFMQDANQGAQNTHSESMLNKLKAKYKSENDNIFQKCTSSAPGLHKSRFDESSIKTSSEDIKMKNKLFTQNQEPIPSQILYSNTKGAAANNLFEKSNQNENSKSKRPNNSSSEKTHSWTLQNKLTISGNELHEENSKQSGLGSKQNSCVESIISFDLDPTSKSKTQSIGSSNKIQEERSLFKGSVVGTIPKTTIDKENSSLPAVPHTRSLTLTVKPEKAENFVRKLTSSDLKANQSEPKSTQSIDRKFESCQFAYASVSKPFASSANGSELGAIPKMSRNDKLSDFDAISQTNFCELAVKPQMFEKFTRGTSCSDPNICDSTKGMNENPKQEQTSPLKNATKATQSTDTDSQLNCKGDENVSETPKGYVLGAIPKINTNTDTFSLISIQTESEPKQSMKSEIHQSVHTKPMLKYNTDSETTTSCRSSECGIENSISLSRMFKNSISQSDDLKVQESQETLKKVGSQNSLRKTKKPSNLFEISKQTETNYSRKSLQKIRKNSSTSISSKNSSDFNKHESLPIMKTSSSTSNVTQIRINKSSSGSVNNSKTDKIKTELPGMNSSPRTEEEHHLPSVSGVVKKLSNSNSEKIHHSSSLHLNKSILNETKILEKREEGGFLSDNLNQNVNIEGVPLGVSEFIQHLQNRVRDCDENVKKQLEEFEKQKHSCLTVCKEFKPDSSVKNEGQAKNRAEEAAAEEFFTTSEKSVSFQEMKTSCSDNASESETDADKSCHCSFCGQEQSTFDISEEIPSFNGCDCMKENYYKIMRIAYNK